MSGYELVAALASNLSWPVVALIVLISLRSQIAVAATRVATFKATKDGIEMTMGETSKEVIGKDPAPQIEKEVQKKQILASGGSASGSYKLYANGVIVTRRMVTLSPGHSSHDLVLPIAMVNEATSVQFIGDIQAKVVKLNQTTIAFEFTPSNVERIVEVVVTGL
ncbi:MULTISPECIES: hypothetical protein [unclassified Pseudomonas]|uniref:hypothetical protein n=1 Tax=unclassified Pseudomonas TaxID=196821 RepID=UPI001CC1BF31|nr:MULTISPECIES: hypothetical protein [unclassified Pseudomonas]